jgi:hypothetical protein
MNSTTFYSSSMVSLRHALPLSRTIISRRHKFLGHRQESYLGQPSEAVVFALTIA